MRKLTLALSAASLAIAGPAFAQSAAPPAAAGHGERHQQAPLTRADAQARADKLFDRLDANHDGKIDAADRAARRDKRRDERFSKLDTDHNGAITREEFAAAGDKARERFAERDRGAEGRNGQRLASAGHRGMRGHHDMRGQGLRRPGEALAMAGKKADTDHDGAISKTEFETAALARFDRADANRDGTVTPDERKQMHAGHRGWHRGGHPSAAG